MTTQEIATENQALPMGLDNIENMPVQVYEGEALKQIVQCVANDVLAIVTDASTEKGRKEIKSLAYKVSRSKTVLDNLGKQKAAEAKATVKDIDAKRKEMRDALDNLKLKVLEPVTAFEKAQHERLIGFENRIGEIKVLGADRDAFGIYFSSSQLEEKLAQVDAVEIDESFEEFQQAAKLAKHDTQAMLHQHIKEALHREKLQAEAEEKRKKEQADREQKIAEEAREKERIRIESAEKAKRDQEAKRKANEAHRQTIHNQIANEFAAHFDVATFDPTEKSVELVEAIAAGKIPHLKICY